MLLALYPIQERVGIKRIQVATYQSVSGAGRDGIEELARQTATLLNGQEAEVKALPHQIAFNIIPQIDVIEEILRVYGFDNIKIENKISMTIPEIGKNKINVIETIISQNLVGIGFNEIINNSICSPSINQRYSDNPISILNPQGTELSNLRASLIPNMLETIKHNSNRQNRNLKLFEFGNSYSLDKENYYENKT